MRTNIAALSLGISITETLSLQLVPRGSACPASFPRASMKAGSSVVITRRDLRLRLRARKD